MVNVFVRPRDFAEFDAVAPRAGLVLVASIVGMIVLVHVGSALLPDGHVDELRPALIVIAAGLHFLPFAKAFHTPMFTVLGSLMFVIGAVGLGLPARRHRVVQTCGVLRAIIGFHQDEVGDWVADLRCLHRQHVRHRPPFWDRPWVLTESGRAEHLGLDLDCPLCDRAEIPDGLHVVRTAGPFDAATLPMGLRADHRVADGRWAMLRVLEGAVRFRMDTDPPVAVHLVVGDEQAIPPGVAHRVIVEDGMRIVIDFLEKQHDDDAG